MVGETWLRTAMCPALGVNDVHVWRLLLAPPRDWLDQCASVLSPAEHERAARFHFERDRTAFTVVRGTLRVLAGRYVDHPPERLGIGYRAKGKPYLTTPDEPLRFNVSHSGDYALLVFAVAREVGVDVEQQRALHDLLSVAKSAFSPQECAALHALPAHEQTDAFFACWSRKEAFIKATGEGVSQLGDFEVNLRPAEPARILRIAGLSPEQHRWSIHDLPPIPGHAAALVVEGNRIHLSCWDHESSSRPT